MCFWTRPSGRPKELGRGIVRKTSKCDWKNWTSKERSQIDPRQRSTQRCFSSLAGEPFRIHQITLTWCRGTIIFSHDEIDSIRHALCNVQKCWQLDFVNFESYTAALSREKDGIESFPVRWADIALSIGEHIADWEGLKPKKGVPLHASILYMP